MLNDVLLIGLKYKNENIERKYLNNVGKKQFLKVKNGPLELGNDVIELKDKELKDREVKIKRETEELLFKLIIVSIDDMDKFEQKEMRKIRPLKSTWYEWLINYIPEPRRKSVGGKKNTPKDGKGKKLSKSKH